MIEVPKVMNRLSNHILISNLMKKKAGLSSPIPLYELTFVIVRKETLKKGIWGHNKVDMKKKTTIL